MQSHLHLHLGAHKTATTHFQRMLDTIAGRTASEVLIPTQANIRKEITHANRFLIFEHQREIQSFLSDLLSSGNQNVVISEENLIGEAKDFFDCDSLYKNSLNRLRTFSNLIPNSQAVTIWFFIRSLDSFLPSIYCEYLRHWSYRDFDSVLNGNYRQSWLPVINCIQSVFPNAHINIVDYHQYRKIVPRVLAEITGDSSENLPEQFKVVRPRLSNFTVQAVAHMPDRMPFLLRNMAVDLFSTISRFTGKSQPYSPFCSLITQQLHEVYKNDIETIRNTPTLTLVEQ